MARGQSVSGWSSATKSIAGIAAFIGAVAGLVGAWKELRGIVVPTPVDVPAAHSVPVAPPPSPAQPAVSPPGRVTLLWVPSDCPSGSTPAIALGSCGEQRSLEWLRMAMDNLRREKRFGFDFLPAGFKLVAGAFGDNANYKLAVHDRENNELCTVGVGYNLKENKKDGGLRLYKRATLAGAFYGTDQTWTDAR